MRKNSYVYIKKLSVCSVKGSMPIVNSETTFPLSFLRVCQENELIFVNFGKVLNIILFLKSKDKYRNNGSQKYCTTKLK